MNKVLFHLIGHALLLTASGASMAQILPAVQTAPAAYGQHAGISSPPCAPDEVIQLDVPLNVEQATITTYDAGTHRLRVFYPMLFNDLTEGWNWHPEEAAAGNDYYTFKYLPLGAIHESRGNYRSTDPAGQGVDYPIRWRWDYFFAFDNPYDFYSRDAGDDSGFSIEPTVTAETAQRLAQGALRMALRGRLRPECLAESTTFWKATVSAPVEFTLKKRYLIGKLEAVWFYDADTGLELGRRTARQTIGQNQSGK